MRLILSRLVQAALLILIDLEKLTALDVRGF